MKWFLNLKIGAKLIAGFVTVAVISAIIGTVGIINLNTVERNSADMYNLNTLPLGDIAELGMSFEKNQMIIHKLVIDSNNIDKEMRIRDIQTNDDEFAEHLVSYEKTIRTSSGFEEMKRLKGLIQAYTPIRNQAIELAKEEKDQQAIVLLNGKISNIADSIYKSINKLMITKTQLAAEKSKSNNDLAKQAIWISTAFIICGFALAVILGVSISRVISKPVKQMVHAANGLASGDVNIHLEASTRDEIGQLMDAFAKMAENIRDQALTAERIASGDYTVEVRVNSERDLLGQKLKQMVETNNEVLGNINSAAEQVAAGSKQVSVSSQALSQGSTEQAGSLEEITASITEIANKTRENAMNANEANELANSAKESAVEGNIQMQSMLRAMQEINESSSSISKIIKVIDDIAFQTNILALNAAVEAARAGQHGKGFAVVAEEVRNLAARSADAAKETTGLIEGSIRKVEAGTKIAHDTASALGKIVKSVADASNLVAEIASSSNQQASAISQVNTGIEQISQVTQSNTATAEESAAASEELSSQAELLKKMVSRFTIKKNVFAQRAAGEVSPEMLRILEEIVEKKNTARTGAASPISSESKSKIKIDLDDKEFGKY